jgi:endonuclease/exonuclease/phosphatase family metal-dependent hydrolase
LTTAHIDPPRARRRSRRLLAAAGATAAVALVLGSSCSGWRPSEFAAAAPSPPRPAIARAGHVGVVTFNTWRLREPARVPRLYAALEAFGADLGLAMTGDAPSTLPDVIALQELEAQPAIDALAARLVPTHEFRTCVCAANEDGSNRSVVGLAVRRGRFDVRASQCVELGALWPDHTRCALVETIQLPDAREPLMLTATHLSSRPFSGGQADRLVAELRAHDALSPPDALVVGDFNFTPGSHGYRALTSSSLRDPFDPSRGRTHWFSGRVDHIFCGPGLTLVRTLDRALAYRVVQPGSTRELPSECRRDDHRGCPLSDHLPEGGVFRYATRDSPGGAPR